MDRFDIPVKEKDVRVIVGHERISPILEHRGVNIKTASYSLYRNPKQGEKVYGLTHTLGSGLEHRSRLDRLVEMKPKGLEDFVALLKSYNSPPVIKLAEPGKKPLIAKTSHTRETLRFESWISQLMSELRVGPKYIDGNYINPRAFVIVEEYVSEDTGYNPIFLHAGQPEAKDEFPRLLGELVGRMQGYHDWTTTDGVRHVGNFRYSIRMFPHLYYNPKNNTLRMLDFGQGRLLPPREAGSMESLANEATVAAKVMLLSVAYPFVYGVSARHPSLRTYQSLLDSYCESYTKASGIPLAVDLKDVISVNVLKTE
jgi:hypothetical protein